ncbi:uncharacterized protein LOC144573099 [Carex rostrata]
MSMSMSNKNAKKCTSDSIPPSNWCSHPTFFLSLLHRTHKLPNPPPLPPNHLSPDYNKRLRELERDINSLKARIIAQKHHSIPTNRRLINGDDKDGDEAPPATRFSDGSFLHEITSIGKPWDRLCIHVSLPTVAEEASTAAEVLQRMTTMKIADLCQCLMSLMPMANITGLKSTAPAIQPFHPETDLDFLIEAILFDSVKKFKELVLEGLKIQLMGVTGRAENYTEAIAVASTDLEARASRSTDRSDCIVLVVLIQVRDPKEEFGSVGELMIGLIEAQLGENGTLQFSIQGVHVAGLNLARNKIAGRDFLWSASLKCCGGSDGLEIVFR